MRRRQDTIDSGSLDAASTSTASTGRAEDEDWQEALLLGKPVAEVELTIGRIFELL